MKGQRPEEKEEDLIAGWVPMIGNFNRLRKSLLGWVPEKEKVKMKKVMFAAAALAAGVAVADGIQSANIVG